MKVSLPPDAALELSAADIESQRPFFDAEQAHFQRLRSARACLDSHRNVVFQVDSAAGAVDLVELVARLFGKEIAAQIRTVAPTR